MDVLQNQQLLIQTQSWDTFTTTSMSIFTTTKVTQDVGARLGRLTMPSRTALDTPHYVALTSRGVVPHLTPDNTLSETHINGVYVALEDFIEKAPGQTPPLYNVSTLAGRSSLRRYMCLPESILSIIGARRTPSVISPVANTNSAISICTSYGFRQLEVVDYIKAVRQLRPDIVLAPADVVFGRSVSSRRIDKMGTRSITWLGALLAELRAMSGENEAPIPALFAPILAIDAGLQTDYLENLVEELPNGVNGIATYDTSVLLDIPSELKPLPRLSLSEPGGPVQLLREIYLGIDICTSPFVGAATDAGIALTFTFANESGKNDERLPLAIDLWEPSYKVDTGPIFASCSCYACQTHHKAYIHHLLTAQEMLAWVLLQIHNCSMMDAFFTAVRKSIGDGSFETLKGEFELLYEPELPQQTGAGPRIRGYQTKSVGGGEARKNTIAYRPLDRKRTELEEASLE